MLVVYIHLLLVNIHLFILISIIHLYITILKNNHYKDHNIKIIFILDFYIMLHLQVRRRNNNYQVHLDIYHLDLFIHEIIMVFYRFIYNVSILGVRCFLYLVGMIFLLLRIIMVGIYHL